MENTRKQIIDIILRSQNILIMPSAPADGDSLGSALALYLVFKKLGKEATVVSAEPVPDAFQFLPTTNVIHHDFSLARDFIVTLDCEKAKIDTIKTKLEPNKVNIIITAKKGQFSADEVSFHHGPSKYDVIITVDTGDLSQLGKFYEDNTELFTSVPVLNIDHHASNGHFGRINMVDIMASATTEILMPLIEELEKVTDQKLMDEDIATLLLAGVITDTGSFQNANTTPKSFATAAQLVKYGARQQEIIHHVFKTKRLSTLRLWGRILSNIKVDQKYHLVWSTISTKDFEDTGAREDETGGIIDELLTNAPGTEIVLILKQKTPGIISGSTRTLSTSIDASQIAGMFGGGGHVQAAGFKIQSGDLAKTEAAVIEKIKAYQKQRLNIIDEEEPAIAEPTMADREAQKQLQQVVQEHLKEIERIETPQLSPEVEKKTVAADPGNSVEKNTRTKPETSTDISFTDVITRQGKSDQPVELDPGMTYKFEQ